MDQNNTNKTLFQEFLNLIKTDSDKEVLVREIDISIDNVYKVEKEAAKSLKELRANTLELLQKAKDKEAGYLGFLKSLRQIVLDLPGISLTVALSPTQDMIDEISEWLVNTLGKNVVISIKLKPEIIGGAEISYLGKYHSLTLDKILEEELNKAESLTPKARGQNLHTINYEI